MIFHRIIFITLIVVSLISAQSKFTGRIGLAIGYNIEYDFTDFSVFSSNFLKTSKEEKLSNGFLTNNFNGYLYTLVIPNTRIGFLFSNGKKESNLSSNKLKSVEYKKNLFGLTVEYTASIKTLNISPGILLGKGKSIFHLYNYTVEPDFNDLVNWFNSNISNFGFSTSIQMKFYELSPMINLEVDLHRFVALRFGITYHLLLSKDWRLNGKLPLENVPDKLITNSLSISTGLMIGFFSR